MRPLNSYLVCKDLDSNTSKTTAGFEVQNSSKFKKLEVIESSDDEVKKGDVVKVSVNAGEQDEDFVIIRRGDIVYIV